MRALTSSTPGSTSDTIEDLHRALDELGFGGLVTAIERQERRYGDGTRDGVGRLQTQFGWPAPQIGVLDPGSATLLNEALVERGVLQVAQGRLVSDDGSALTGRLLFAFDVDFVNSAQFGEATTNADGAYRLIYDPRFYAVPGPGHEQPKDGLALVICAYGADERETARSEPRPDPGRIEDIDLVAHALEPEPAEPDFVVRGTVRGIDGRTAKGVTVTAYDRDLGDAREPLGEDITGPDGAFAIAYSTSSFRAEEGRGSGADLVFELRVERAPVTATVFRVFGGVRAALPLDGEELRLGIPAGADEAVAFHLTSLPVPEGSEYERLMASLRPLLGERSPATLDEAEHRDISFAAREISGDRDHITMLVAAHVMAEQSFDRQVSPELLYGLGRCEQHLADLARLTLAGAEKLSAGIRQAIDLAIIGEQPDERVAATVKHITQAGPELLRAGVGGAAYGPVLETLVPDPEAQRALLREAAGRQDDPSGLWDALRADPAFAAPGSIQRAQLAVQLDALTDRHLPLMAALHTERGITATEDLLDISQAELATLITQVGVPAETPGADDEQRAQIYAAGLLGQVHQAFPAMSVARSVAAAPAEAVGGEPVRAALATALTRAGQGELRQRSGFDLGATHLDSYLAEHGNALLEGVDENLRAKVIPELKRTQRLYRVSTGPPPVPWTRFDLSGWTVGGVPDGS